MNLIIDIGNTRTKLAVFEDNKLVENIVCDFDQTLNQLVVLEHKYKITLGILSSVVHLKSDFVKKVKKITQFLELTSSTKVPFQNLYKTPTTLGLDRIALVSAAVNEFPNKNCLIIDAGTCITYDFIDSSNNYHGGAISPGLTMRYNSLNDYTSKLPKLSFSDDFELVGYDTKSSIHSGVLNGIIYEIDGVINQYKSQYQDLTIVLTGGDVNFLSKQLKNSIFANQNFLLIGLNTILNFNN